jgi:hypothetical protein
MLSLLGFHVRQSAFSPRSIADVGRNKNTALSIPIVINIIPYFKSKLYRSFLFFLPFVLIQIGVPSNPNASRI